MPPGGGNEDSSYGDDDGRGGVGHAMPPSTSGQLSVVGVVDMIDFIGVCLSRTSCTGATNSRVEPPTYSYLAPCT